MNRVTIKCLTVTETKDPAGDRVDNFAPVVFEDCDFADNRQVFKKNKFLIEKGKGNSLLRLIKLSSTFYTTL